MGFFEMTVCLCRFFGMRGRTFLLLLLLGLMAGGIQAKPNVIFVLVDNLGNGDVKCFNAESLHRTPNLDQMAAEGMKLTSFYACSGVCTPSRASAMTGCYPRRVNLHENHESRGVLRPLSPKGLHPDEVTMAEVLKAAGYATKIIGKWHLGDQPEFLPTRQGFDEYFGIPYSDDMTKDKRPETWPELPLMKDEAVIEAPVDRDYLTKRYTEEAIRWIKQKKAEPFFLYLPHAMPGSTTAAHASPAFQGRSANGKWGDSIEELDWSMGEILKVLKEEGLDENTLVVWTSDNGAPRRNPPQGSNAPYAGWGYNTSEGAMRMPCIVRWPGRLPAGVSCDALCSVMDLLPTFAGLAGAKLPEQKIDGRDMAGVWFGERGNSSPYDETGFFYYHADQLQAVRSGPWKLYLELPNKVMNLADKTEPVKAALYDVRTDVSETSEVSAQQPGVVARLMALAEQAREELGDVGRAGKGQRPAGWVESPTARVLTP
jgi:arylsulfatase A